MTTQLHALAVLPPVAIDQEAARVPEQVWTFGEREKNLASSGIGTPDPPADSLVIPTELFRLLFSVFL